MSADDWDKNSSDHGRLRQTPKFGVAGNPPNFFLSTLGKDRLNAPEWLASISLDALEIQCTRGVRMSAERAMVLRMNAESWGITLSIHGPYYITLGTPAQIEQSLQELRKCLDLARLIGSTRIVFHPGKVWESRKESVKTAVSALRRFESEHDLQGIHLLPEVVGCISQLGSLDDVLSICEEVNSAWPCLDMAHHHARSNGCLRATEDFENMLTLVEGRLGQEGLKNSHFHMYPIEWGPKGEIRHRAFEDRIEVGLGGLFTENPAESYLPRYEPFLTALHARDLAPIIICEAKESQDIGAKAMKAFWAFLQSSAS